MLNLLRMDLYRLKRSKTVYICLALLLGMAALCYWMIWIIETPEGRSFAAKIGMSALEELYESESMLSGYNTLHMYREICMDGGAYSCLFGLIIALFVCLDFKSGFIKNIMSLHRNRWKYIGSKLITAGILNMFCMVIQYIFSLLMNLLFDTLVPFAGIADTLFYLTWAWLITTAFASLVILICIFTRSSSASITATFLLGCGILVTVLSYFTGLFNAGGWVPYTLYHNITYGPSAYSSIQDLKIYAIGLVFLIIYSAAAAVTLSRKDI